MKRRIIVFGLPVVALAIFSFSSPAERYFEIAKNLDIFATLFKEVNAAYVDEVNPSTLVKTGIDAMLESLDPYTNYIPEDMVEDFRALNTGQYGGIGAYTRKIGNRTVVTMVLEGYTAQRSGLKIGDEVIKIDDKELAKLEPGDVGEDEAAQALANAAKGANVRADKAFTGRANLFAETAGVLVVDGKAVGELNLIDEAITFATLPAFSPVAEGQMIATAKIIPFAVSSASHAAALAAAKAAAVHHVDHENHHATCKCSKRRVATGRRWYRAGGWPIQACKPHQRRHCGA